MKTQANWLMIGAALALGACTTKNQSSSMEILRAVPPTSSSAPDAGASQQMCVFSLSTAEYAQQHFNTSQNYYIGVVIENHLSSNANTVLGRLNTNDWVAVQAVTTYESTDGTAIDVGQQITPTSGTILAGATGIVGATLIPAAVAAKLAGVTSVRLHTHIEGRLLDGSTVSTNEYMPIFIPVPTDTDSSSCVFSGG